VLWERYFTGLARGSHSFSMKCDGLVGANASNYSANVTILFNVRGAGSFGSVEETGPLPPLPTAAPPLPSPRPQQAQSYVQLECPRLTTKSPTIFNALLYVEGRPKCDSNTRVTVTVNGEAGKGALNVCRPENGEHEISVDSAKAGNYTVKVESLTYALSSTCSFEKRGGTAADEEAPDLPWVLAVFAALAALWAISIKRKG